VLIGMILNLAAFVLLYVITSGVTSILLTTSILTTFSTPYIKTIFFVRTEEGTEYGSFGYCTPGGCTAKSVGYDNGPEVTEWLTRTQLLFGIGESTRL